MRSLRSRTKLSAAVALTVILVLGLASIAAAQNAGVADPPLNFGTNYFVTGDYVAAGAQGLNGSFGNDGFGTGIISFPDGNPGIRGATTVPKGANIVAAILYWQTVEKTNQFGSGQKGFFRAVFPGGPAKGYPISGFNVPNQNATSFSNGGCSGLSTGKAVRTYRADVRGYLPLDSSGNVLSNLADGVTFEVRLPNVGLNTPYTLGATLVLVFRVLDSPNYPLSAITIYDGSFAPNNMPGPPFTMTQSIQGFYQAANSPVSKLTHIVGAGKSNKFQQAYLGGGQGGVQRAATALPSPYGNGQPDFPGHYMNWDTTTWVFPDPTFPGHPNLPNPLQENDDSATAMVVASGANPGCVSWGATIVSTTVHDDEKDGILQVWKHNQGYTDVATGLPVSLADPADPINVGHPRQDIFIQLDHVVDANGDFTPNPLGEVKMVHDAFLAHNVHLHFTDASQTTGIAGANAIQEPALTDGSQGCLGGLCPYPNQIGITSWRDGFEFVKNQPLNYNTEAECELNSPPFVAISNTNCIRRFPIQQRLTHHYVIWGDTLGGPNWTFFGGSLTDSTGTAGLGAGVVAQTGANTVTFYTTRGHGLTVDPLAGNGRVTVANAFTNPSLNETHLVTSVICPVNPDTIPPTGLGDCSVSNRALGPYSFTISVAGNAGAKYTALTDPYLSVESGQAGTGSGFSDVGGAGTLVTLGQWGPQATLQAKAGTFMHEMGHTLGLLHGGGDNTNCKSNYQSVMNYMFQAHLLGPGAVLDFSNQQLSTLDETSLGPITAPNGFAIPYGVPYTKWYDTPTLDFKVATVTSFGITSNVVTFQAANTFKAGDKVQITGLTTGAYLNGQVLTVFSAGLSNTQFQASFAHADVTSTADSGTAKTTMPVPIGDVADHHCDGTSLTINDPAMSKYAGGTTLSPDVLAIPWSGPSLDANFEGSTPGKEAKFLGYSDWANADFRQVGAGGNEYFSVPGAAIPGGPGGAIPGGPGGAIPGGPGGAIPGGPGIIGNNGKGDLDFATAVSTIDPPSGLTASEGTSARTITLTWNTVGFPLIAKYNIYRSADQGATFSFLKSVVGPPATDNVICNPGGYQYLVTAVFQNTAPITSFSINSNVVTFHAANNFTAGTVVEIAGLTTGTYLNGQGLTILSTGLSSTQFEAHFTHANVASTADSGTAVSTKESARSNIVSTGQNGGLLTGCYTSPGAPASVIAAPSVAANAVHGTIVSVTFTVLTDFNASNSPVNTTDNPALVTLAAIGPGLLANGCGTVGPTTLLNSGQLTPQSGALSTFPASSAGLYTFNWDTDGFCAGSYTFKLTLDSAQTQTSSPLLVSIDVTDRDNPHVATTALPAGTVGVVYNNTVTEDGGTAPFTWSFAGSLPTGITLGASTGTLAGTTCVAGPYSFTAMVTDAKSNSGLQALTLQINKANTATVLASNANPSVFQQMVTFTVTVAQQPPSICTPTGTVTLYDAGIPIPGASNLALSGGMATFATSALTVTTVSPHSITATYSGDSNFNGSTSAPPLAQTVNKANTAIAINSVLPSPAFVGQPITVAYTLTVVAPGAGVPIGPSGTVTVMASDGSGCSVPAVLGPGACVLSPTPTTAGNRTFTVAYSGDSNFVNFMTSGADNYTVYQLVFLVQPSNTVATNTMTPVQVAAQDGSSNTLTTFGGGITLAIKSGPGTLSGTATQTAVNGVATFNDLSINKVATGDTLVASLTGGVAPAISNAFSITLALNYTQLQPTTSPSTRCCVAMAFDPVSNSTLLFGGTHPVVEGQTYTAVGDTWSLQGGQWTQLSPGTSPSARTGASMVYDAAHNNIVLFGGTSLTNNVSGPDLNDTWIWNGTTWTQQSPSTIPPARRFDSQGMAYDPNTQTVVMFGGIDVTNQVFFGDTWVWNGTNWVPQTPSSSPSARRTVLATDPTGNVMLFGGTGSSGNLADTWVWNGTNWNLQSPATSPTARDLHNMAFNPSVGAVVLFAGGGGLNDVWSWDGTTWTQVTAAAPTPQRFAFGMDYDVAANAIFVFGGFTANGPAVNDTWQFTVVP